MFFIFACVSFVSQAVIQQLTKKVTELPACFRVTQLLPASHKYKAENAGSQILRGLFWFYACKECLSFGKV